jgi:hypothetical protein
MREYSRLLDSQHEALANIGTEEAVLYTATAESCLRFAMMHKTAECTDDRTISIHHWGDGETACDASNEILSQVMYSGIDLYPEWPIPGLIVEAGEKIVANPDTLDGLINISLVGAVKYAD